MKGRYQKVVLVLPDFFLESYTPLFAELLLFCLLVPPDPPVLELKEAKGSTISLVWTPAFEGDSPITGYYLESKTTNGDLLAKPVFASKQS